VLGRSLLAFLAFPAVVGILAPWLLAASDPARRAPWAPGIVLVAAGLAGLVWCVRDFHVVGRGTLAPWAPPRRLVVVGLYRFVRNPMYLSVLTLVAGFAAWRASPRTALYAAALAIAFHLRVVLAEEPWLARTFGEEWTAYARAVRRWVPRARGWRDAPQ